MDGATLTVSIINLGVTVILGGTSLLLWVKNRSYRAEKGKNLATKEDVGEITKIVEGIKVENSKQLELMRTEMSFVASQQSLHATKKREAVMCFFEDCVALIYDKLTIQIDKLPQHKDALESYEKSMRELCAKIYVGAYRLLVYFPDNDPVFVPAERLCRACQRLRIEFERDFPAVLEAKSILQKHMTPAGIDPVSDFHKFDLENDVEKAVHIYHNSINAVDVFMKQIFGDYLKALNTFLSSRIQAFEDHP